VAVVLGPDGKVLARYAKNEEQILFAALTDKMLREVRDHPMKYFLPRRRQALYDISAR
jgi:predicted amidohydrolase